MKVKIIVYCSEEGCKEIAEFMVNGEAKCPECAEELTKLKNQNQKQTQDSA